MPRAALVGVLPQRSAARGHVKATEVATSALRLRRGTAGTGSSSSSSSSSGSGGKGTGPSTSSSSGNVGSRAAQLFELEKEGGYVSTAPGPRPAAGSSSSSNSNNDTAAADGGNGDFLDAGWGVVAVAPAGGAAAAVKPVAKKDKKKKAGPAAAAGAVVSSTAAAAAEAAAAKRQARADSRGTPFVDKNSEAGITGLTLLQQRLLEAGRVAHSDQQKQRVAAEAAARRERLAATAGRKKDWVDPDELDEGDEDEEVGFDEMDDQQQYFELNLEADGTTEVVEFDEEGRERLRRAPGAAGPSSSGSSRRAAAAADVDDDDDDPLAFLNEDRPRAAAAAAAATSTTSSSSSRGLAPASPSAATASRRRTAASASEYEDDDDDDDDDFDYNGDGLPGSNPIADEEVEWGLDELHAGGRRPSLLREMGVIKTKKDKKKKNEVREEARIAAELAKAQAAAGGKKGAAGKGAGAAAAAAAAGKPGAKGAAGSEDEEDEDEMADMGVAWGGSGGASGIDMEAQEALLTRLFKPHKVKQLMEHQRAAEEELAAMKRKATGKQVLDSKTHSRMRIISGSAAGRQLASSKGSMTRPMMEKVRQAIFNMIQAQAGSGGGLPTTARWLDFFAGTGSVGLEALSRGCRECHFIELDSWVCRKVLSRNIATCGFERQAVVHTMKAEDFLRKSIQLPRFAGGAFDFISVCPPYLVVSYPELMGLLEASPLIHDRSIVFVEYPKQLSHQVPTTLGPLVTVRDRRYGRTWIRVYGPADGPVVAGDGEDDEGFEEEGEEGAQQQGRGGGGRGARRGGSAREDDEELLI
ncbi:hypothetical protein HYH02_010511 [Chlamydomonas schloesseri]|uniref:Uncharacterized protein n=1 Tax=Chlamydomonas schloesseri TaxID=2026947 RepID=A0A835TJZ1_9CHLO|nr:hypothetical protein HYH02_010511 [Chlamydomonas schloesseri]|eukprot:KAG2439881.1 hypothetical protein HYH02_010511 [Chlamydomonas schloesseri]